VFWLQVTTNVDLRSPILVNLMMEAIHSSESSVLISHTASHPRRRPTSYAPP
jgi:hypothetical protein